MSKSKILTIFRGCPGSGKSTLAKALATAKNGVICSTDDFFLDDKGVYQFNMKKLGFNHQANQEKARKLMKEEHPCVIIDNTNITRKEMKPYVDMAAEFGYTVHYVAVHCDVEVCIKRNTHNVPEAIIRSMAEKFHYDHRNPDALRIDP